MYWVLTIFVWYQSVVYPYPEGQYQSLEACQQNIGWKVSLYEDLLGDPVNTAVWGECSGPWEDS